MSALHQELKEFIIRTLSLDDITPADIGDDMLLFGDGGLGLDSIDALELVLGLKKSYGLVLDANDEHARQHLRSVDALASLVGTAGAR